MAARSGNLLIIDEENDTILGVTGSDLVETFECSEAKVINRFFMDDLKALAENSAVIREPKVGDEVYRFKITYKTERARSVGKAIDDLKTKIRQLPEKEIFIPQEKNKDFVAFETEVEKDNSVVLLYDGTPGTVKIIGKDQTAVDSATNRLKIRVGLITPTNSSRKNRQVMDDRQSSSHLEKIINNPKSSSFKDSPSYSGSTDYQRNNSFVEKRAKFSSSASSSSRSYSTDSDEDVRFETELKNGMLLKVYKASITKLDVEVIVNAANDNMMHGGGVARVISEAAGYKMNRESQDYVATNGSLSVAENIVTTAGKLRQYKAVIHAVGPEWYKYSNKVECLDALFDCVYNILETCTKKNFNTVGMSAISAGIFGVPKQLCADIYVYAAYKYSSKITQTECPRELHIIDVDTSILKLIGESIGRWQNSPESLNPRVSVPKFLEENPQSKGAQGFSSVSGHRPRHHGRRSAGHSSGANEHGRDGQADGAGDQLSGAGDSTQTICYIKRLQDEKFYWGSTAAQFLLDKQITVKIYKGFIEKVTKMDAIVCGTNESLQQRGYIAEALSKAGGQTYQSACEVMSRKHATNASVGDAYKCKPGNLGAKFVVHSVCKRVLDANEEEIASYQKCVANILKKVQRNRLGKIALPLLGTGTIQTNKQKLRKCGFAVLKALDFHIQEFKGKNEIKEVHLINNSDLVSESLVEVFVTASALCDSKMNGRNYSLRNARLAGEMGAGSEQGGSVMEGGRGLGRGGAGHRRIRDGLGSLGTAGENTKGKGNNGERGVVEDVQMLDNVYEEIKPVDETAENDDDNGQYDTIGDPDTDQNGLTDSTNGENSIKDPVDKPVQLGNLNIIFS